LSDVLTVTLPLCLRHLRPGNAHVAPPPKD
jgi:hypothetical protein